eukprot:2890978-Karenia_brevis.AAC.1
MRHRSLYCDIRLRGRLSSIDLDMKRSRVCMCNDWEFMRDVAATGNRCHRQVDSDIIDDIGHEDD